jgi:HSP20 family molecular chaperone IbpA
MFGLQRRSSDPFGDLFSTWSVFDSALFEGPEGLARTAKVDVVDGEGKVDIVVDAPGYDKDGIDVSVEDGVLTISGTRKSATDDTTGSVIRRERREESFARSFSLSDSHDAKGVTASLKDGVLTVSVPKVEPKPKAEATRIEVRQG